MLTALKYAFSLNIFLVHLLIIIFSDVFLSRIQKKQIPRRIQHFWNEYERAWSTFISYMLVSQASYNSGILYQIHFGLWHRI